MVGSELLTEVESREVKKANATRLAAERALRTGKLLFQLGGWTGSHVPKPLPFPLTPVCINALHPPAEDTEDHTYTH